jgi:NADH:ubiquinone reductase (H+-translocating)
MAGKKHILILGSGFGGLYAAMHLDGQAGEDFDLTLIDSQNFFMFTPLIQEVAAGDLEPQTIISSTRKILKNSSFLQGRVCKIDLSNKQVCVDHGAGHVHCLSYDHLIIALGTVTNYFGNTGVEKHAFTMKTMADAIALRNHLIANLEEAEFECCKDDPYLTVVVAGGGYAGVETVASMNDFLREVIHLYPNLDPDCLRIVLVHSKPLILPELNERLRRYAQEKIIERKVEVLTNVRVADFDGRKVTLSNGTEIETNTLVWTPGNGPNPIVEGLPLAKNGFRIVVNNHLRVPDSDGLWAIGDCVYLLDPKTNRPYPSTAQHAIAQGQTAARNILAEMRGKEKKEFHFTSLGTMAQIGNRAGVASMMGLNLSGWIPWFLRRTAYLMKQPRLRQRFRIAIDWTFDLLFPPDLAKYGTQRSKTNSKPT